MRIFAIDDFDSVPDDELYERQLNEFLVWLKEAKEKRIILSILTLYLCKLLQ